MIKILIHNEKWRISLQDEVWEFETREQFEILLNIMIDYKEAYGKIKDKSYE